MEFHLDRLVRLSQESKYKGLYAWCIQEISDTGEQIGSDQIPWHWSLYFSASEVRHNKKLSIKELSSQQKEVTSSESIRAVLHYGFVNADGFFEHEAVYSMFGTNRQIQKFRLSIRPLEATESEEACEVWGGVSYTAEIDFRNETEDDSLEIFVAVSPERFKELRTLVNHVGPDMLVIRLAHVFGFYSDWSPSISTNRIKVLTGGSEHKVEIPSGCEVAPLRLGRVGEFHLLAARRNALELKRETEELEDEDEPAETAGASRSDVGQALSGLMEQLAKSQAKLEGLKWPIWAIVVLLMLLYLK